MPRPRGPTRYITERNFSRYKNVTPGPDSMVITRVVWNESFLYTAAQYMTEHILETSSIAPIHARLPLIKSTVWLPMWPRAPG